MDLGSHFALDLEGEEDAGREEECLIGVAQRAVPARGVVFTHRNLLALARGAVDAVSLIKGDHVLAAMPWDDLAAFALTLAGPLLAGARVTSMPAFDACQALYNAEGDDVTLLVGSPAMYAAMADALATRATKFAAPALRVCACLGGIADTALQERWHQLTGLELRQAIGVPAAPLVLFSAPHVPNHRGAFGVPYPGVQVMVHGAQNGVTATAGELWVRGDQVCASPFPVNVATSRSADGWHATGLRVRARSDGAFEPHL